MPAPIVIFLAWVGTKAVTSIASAAVSKLVSIPVDKALGIEIQGATVGAWAETAALAIFAGGSLTPEPTFEQKVSSRFRELQSQVDELRRDPAWPYKSLDASGGSVFRKMIGAAVLE